MGIEHSRFEISTQWISITQSTTVSLVWVFLCPWELSSSCVSAVPGTQEFQRDGSDHNDKGGVKLSLRTLNGTWKWEKHLSRTLALLFQMQSNFRPKISHTQYTRGHRHHRLRHRHRHRHHHRRRRRHHHHHHHEH